MGRKEYIINHPPDETVSEPLFRVIYVIDVNAVNPIEAAKLTHRIMTDHDSLPPVLEVMDHKGTVEKIDLSKNI